MARDTRFRRARGIIHFKRAESNEITMRNGEHSAFSGSHQARARGYLKVPPDAGVAYHLAIIRKIMRLRTER